VISSTGDNAGNGNGVTHSPVAVLTFTLDLTTHQVAIGGQPMPLTLAMMIAGEGMRILEEQRRVAAAMVLRQQLADQAANKAVAAALRRDKA
jgi:hypothetical protein